MRPSSSYRRKPVSSYCALKRAWKIGLIERINPDWRDLFDEIAR